MKSVALRILTIIVFLAPCFASGKSRGKKAVPFIEASVNHEKAVEGERLIYEVTLFTPDASIAGIELVSEPDFGELARRRSAADIRLSETERNGEKYYSVVIDRFFLGLEEEGKHTLKGGCYRIGYNRQEAVNDPFWGPGYVNRVEVEELSAPDVTVKASPLPEKGRPDNFSGAVGNFNVTVSVPSGEIIAGEEAYLVVTLSGDGDLSGVAPPDVRQAFAKPLQFKSMTENRNEYISKGELGSELEMECVFVAEKEGTFTIGPISFSYFNPRTRKYEQAESTPVTIEVESGSASKSSPPVYIEI